MGIKIDPTKTHLFLATPAYGARLHTSYVRSMLVTSNLLTVRGIPHTPVFLPGESLITRARNVIVAMFMAKPHYDPLLFIDGDISWNAEDVLRLLAATQAFPEIEVAGGIYPKKCLPPEFPLNFMPGADRGLNQHLETGYIEIKDAPTGFLMVRRSAIAKMMAAYPERKCYFRLPSEAPADEVELEYDLFSCFIDNGRYVSEDFGFSRLWQRIGGKVWMDPAIKLGHHGEYEYRAEISSRLIAADHSSRPTDARQIEGWMNHDELEFLEGLAREAESIVEVGCWKGRSTYALAANCTGPVYAVDHFLGSEDERSGPHREAVTGDVFTQFLHNVGHFPNLHIVKKPSLEAVAEVPEVDVVFIDAGHRYEDVVADIRAWKPKARKVICGHDAVMDGVARAVREELGELVLVPGTTIWVKEVAA